MKGISLHGGVTVKRRRASTADRNLDDIACRQDGSHAGVDHD
jgi:hypothetical protein